MSDMKNLDKVIAWLEPSVGLLSRSDRLRLEGQLLLVAALLWRYEQSNDESFLDRAIKLLEGYASEYPSHGYRRTKYLELMAWASVRAAESSDTVAAAESALHNARQADHEAPNDATVLMWLGIALVMCSERTGQMRLLHKAVDAHERAVALTDVDDLLLASRQSVLGNALTFRAALLGDTSDMQRAISAHRKAVAAAQESDPGLATFLGNLGNALLQEYDLLGDPQSLTEAISVQHEAVASSRSKHVQHVVHLEGLANALLYQYERFGDEDAVAKSIALRRCILKQLAEDHPMRIRVQSNLAGVLLRRSERSEDTDSLSEAEHLIRQVLEKTDPSSPQMPNRTNMLGVVLGRRWQSGTGTPADLDESVNRLRKAIDSAPDGDVLLPMFQSNLAVFLIDVFDRLRSEDRVKAERALLEAVNLHRQAVHATPLGHSEHGRRVANLAVVLTARAQYDQDPQILDEADAVCQPVLDFLAEHDPDRSRCLSVAGQINRCRYELTGDRQAGLRARDFYRQAANQESAAAITRIQAARNAGMLGEMLNDSAGACEDLGTAVELLERVASPALGHGDQERLLADLTGLPRDAAALATASGDLREAVVLLEQGRGVLLGRMANARTAYDELRDREPELAEQLRDVQSRLDQMAAPAPSATLEGSVAAAAAGSAHSSADQRAELAGRYQQLVEEIRTQAGFEGFLRLPDFQQLAHAAAAGPVAVVNISDYRCDALVLTGDDVLHVPLPQVSSQNVQEQATTFLEATDSADSAAVKTVMEWTWDHIAEPVLQALAMTSCPAAGAAVPRLWWCPTGLAAFLPLHAAGHHDDVPADGIAGSVLDAAACSYTRSVRSLIQLRRIQPATLDTGAKMLVVAVESSPEFPAASALSGVQRDIEELSARFTDLTVLAGADATGDAVLYELAQHPYVHFACHGMADLESPFDGFLVLYDGRLTARRIAAQQLPNARLAFLGACETFRGGTTLPDESISLAAVLQAAGYRDVVATQWMVNELVTATVAAKFYESVLRPDSDGTARALREAIRAVRAESDGVPPVYWAPFIHTGP